MVVAGLLVIPEGNETKSVRLAVNLSVPSDRTVRVDYATADGTATAPKDYKSASGTLTFIPGETRKVIEIKLPKDTKPEDIVEAFFVNLSGVCDNAVILRRGVVHIIDDDVAEGGPAGGAATSGAAIVLGGNTVGPSGPTGVAGRGPTKPETERERMLPMTNRAHRGMHRPAPKIGFDSRPRFSFPIQKPLPPSFDHELLTGSDDF